MDHDTDSSDDDSIQCAMAAGAAAVNHWANILAFGDEVFGPSNSSAGGGSGFMDAEEEEEPNVKRRRNVYEREPCETSPFGRMLEDKEALKDPETREAILFRKRFRLPYQVFVELVKCARNGKWFAEAETDIAGRRTIPVEMKVLAALYVLGRASVMDDVAMLSGMSETSVRGSLGSFCRGVVSDLFHVHVRLPTDDDLKEVMRQYRTKGIPGAMGSIDVTHVLWDRVPAHLHTDHTGKEGKPTLAFEAIVDFTRRVLSITHGYPGSENDKTISRSDGGLEKTRFDELYKTQKFDLYDATGHKRQWQGAFLICDNGYLKWPQLQRPWKTPPTTQAQAYSKQLESVRKDVECFFGILKWRFRVLKSAILFQDDKLISDIFKTCCVLHNILHAWDGLAELEPNTNWAGEDGEPEDGLGDRSAGLGEGGQSDDEDEADPVDQAMFDDLREALATNFAQMKANGEVSW